MLAELMARRVRAERRGGGVSPTLTMIGRGGGGGAAAVTFGRWP